MDISDEKKLQAELELGLFRGKIKIVAKFLLVIALVIFGYSFYSSVSSERAQLYASQELIAKLRNDLANEQKYRQDYLKNSDDLAKALSEKARIAQHAATQVAKKEVKAAGTSTLDYLKKLYNMSGSERKQEVESSVGGVVSSAISGAVSAATEKGAEIIREKAGPAFDSFIDRAVSTKLDEYNEAVMKYNASLKEFRFTAWMGGFAPAPYLNEDMSTHELSLRK